MLLLLRPVLPGVTDEAAPAASGSSSSASLGQLGPGRLSVAVIVFIFTLDGHRWVDKALPGGGTNGPNR